MVVSVGDDDAVVVTDAHERWVIELPGPRPRLPELPEQTTRTVEDVDGVELEVCDDDVAEAVDSDGQRL